jgi:UrcA family protein
MLAKKTLAAVAALAVLGFGAAAHGQTLSVKVSVIDLNLDSEAGAQVALRRIQSAANHICGDEANTRVLSRSALYRACLRSTVDNAVAGVHKPMLTAANEGSGQRAAILASAR